MTSVREFPDWPAGTVTRFAHHSKVLGGNPWQDPVDRDLCVYFPPGYREDAPAYPTLWDFAAFTNSGPGHLNWRNQGETLVQRLDRLIHQQAMPPVVVAMPDCYSSLGGNQYVNSQAVGRYADYVVTELVPFLSERANVVAGREGRGVFGKSSGGYGALVHAMRYPECWGAAAAHAPDCGFELVYRTDFPSACRALAEHGGDPRRFLEVFWRKKHPGSSDFMALLTIAMAASYDPDPQEPARIRLPFDVHTCKVDEQRWNQWLQHDPLNMVNGHAEALKSLACLYIDVGSRDQFNLQFGARSLDAGLEALGISHHFEEFDGTHSNLDWRLDISLPKISRALERAIKG